MVRSAAMTVMQALDPASPSTATGARSRSHANAWRREAGSVTPKVALGRSTRTGGTMAATHAGVTAASGASRSPSHAYRPPLVCTLGGATT